MNSRTSTPDRDRKLRCRECGTVVAQADASGLTIRRGGQKTTIDGEFRTTIVCYRCRTLNIIHHLSEK